MVPPKESGEDFTFIMTCLKHNSQKPEINFEEVAKEIGAKSGKSCYHRHWGIMKKWGLAGNSGAGRKPGTASTPVKRKAEKEENQSSDTNAETPKKRAKPTPKKKAPAPAAPIVKDEDGIEDAEDVDEDEAALSKEKDIDS